MKDPTRLRDMWGNDSLSAVFRTADNDVPPEGSKDALMASFGIGLAASAAAVSIANAAQAGASVGGVVGSGVTAGGGASAAIKFGGIALAAKWIAVSTVVVSGAVATVHFSRAHTQSESVANVFSPSTPKIDSTRRPSANAASVPESSSDSPVAVPVESPTAIVSAPPSTSKDVRAAPASAPIRRAPVDIARLVEEPAVVVPSPAQSAPDVSNEMGRLGRAHALIAQGRASDALTELDEYRRVFSHGELAYEADVLRVEALARAGRLDEARQLAHQFLSSHPKDPLRIRVQNVLSSIGTSR